ncbi:hypothetical protein [Sphingomonas sp. ERG5]|uniref:hypothetical protein n=1 Tax=Sphingomonas sp. ERG5 TaxID=1381597 RepID=UPI00126A0223|nr:hypothetical protein [Sphingomonas sp. ERG5]
MQADDRGVDDTEIGLAQFLVRQGRFNQAAGCRTVTVGRDASQALLSALFHMAVKRRVIITPVSIGTAPVNVPVPPCFHNRGGISHVTENRRIIQIPDPTQQGPENTTSKTGDNSG